MKVFFAVMVALFLFSAQQSMAQSEFKTLTKQEFKMAAQTNDYIILDLRTVEAYMTEHVAEAKLIEFDADYFNSAIENLPRTQKFLIYSDDKDKAMQTLEKMKNLDFLHVEALKENYIAD